MKIEQPTLVQARLLSPLSVGDGGLLSPLADYFIQKGQLHYISPDKLENYLETNELVPQYVSTVRKATNVAKDDFWQELLDLDDLAQIGSGRTARMFTSDNPTEVKTIVRNGKAPFLPGSTLKGALKTALLYSWLFENNQKKLNEMVAIVEGNDRDKFKDTEIERHLNDLLNAQFGERGQMPDFHHLRVSDSQPLPMDGVEIIMTKRLHLEKGSFDIPIAREAVVLPEDRAFGIPITLYPQFQHSSLKYLNSGGLKALFKKVNEFSLDHLGWVLDEVEASRAQIESETPGPLYTILTQWLGALYETIKAAPDNTCYIQLGAGKTYFANSIGLAVFNYDRKTYDNWRSLFKLGKFKQELFPSTIAVDAERNTVTGWVQLSY